MKAGFMPVVCEPQKNKEQSKRRERIEPAMRGRSKTQAVKGGGLRVQRSLERLNRNTER